MTMHGTLLAVFTLGSCYGLWRGHDEMDRYFQRSDTITMSAGDAKQVNAVTHTINPWPRNVGDRRIAYRRSARRRRRDALWQHDTAGGSASRYRTGDGSDGPAASQPTRILTYRDWGQDRLLEYRCRSAGVEQSN